MKKSEYELKGLRSEGKIVLSGIGKIKEDIPRFFIIKIDTLSIRKREKEK